MYPINKMTLLSLALIFITSSADKSQTPSCATAYVIGLNSIYHFKLDESEAIAFQKLHHTSHNKLPKSGDYALLATHVNTKEIKNWTWQTFWWEAGLDSVQGYPGTNFDIIDKVHGVWRNYNMCAVYSQTTKPNKQGDMEVCFNPFLETSKHIADGLRSNCMSCHGTATVGKLEPKPHNKLKYIPQSLKYPKSFSQPVDFGSLKFSDFTKTDFSWAIPVNTIATDAPN